MPDVQFYRLGKDVAVEQQQGLEIPLAKLWGPSA
jgi:hypothetical protein